MHCVRAVRVILRDDNFGAPRLGGFHLRRNEKLHTIFPIEVGHTTAANFYYHRTSQVPSEIVLPPSASTMSSTRLSVLRDLQEYIEASEAGNVALKKSRWQVTKLRRKQNRGLMTMEDTFSADQIREELRARTLVRDQNSAGEPGLITEGQKKKTSSVGGAPKWELVDALEEKIGNKENSSTTGSTAASVSESGLRQRKIKGKPGLENSTAIEKNKDASKMTEDIIVDEEDLLLLRDPLELFSGVRPGDLKMAQQDAKAALDSYIEAACRAARILHQLNQVKEAKHSNM